jgi:hypothetical protein
MRRYLPVFGVILAFFTILGVIAHSLFEVYPRSRQILPSKQALANEYLALDRWLEKTGHPVRVADSGGTALVKKAGESTVFIQASRFDWTPDTFYELEPWVRRGGILVISLDSSWEEAAVFLRSLGVEEGEGGVSGELNPGTGGRLSRDVLGGIPAFDLRIRFSPKEGMEFIGDVNGVIRLVMVPLGEGSVTVLGIPYFMRSQELEKPPNARLSWELTGAGDRENRGVLFIRARKEEVLSGEREPGLFEKISRRGKGIPLAVSLLVVLAVWFWMLIPGFGRPGKDGGESAKPIEERFLAEARFLKKYHALGGYLDVYIREIEAKLRQRRGLGYVPEPQIPGACSGEGLVRRVFQACDQTGLDLRLVEKALCHGPRVNYPDFVKYRIIMETILERL